MLRADLPNRMPTAFATSGTKFTVPRLSAGILGYASYDTGFPDETMKPLAAGGQAPQGPDFNGVLFDISNWVRWMNAGGPIPYDSGFATLVGGYPRGALLSSTAYTGFWQSLVDGNMTDPDSVTTMGWTSFGRIKLLSNLDLYVSNVSGNDSNSGRASGTAFATLQKAWDTVVSSYDLNGFVVTVHLATSGTPNAGLFCQGSLVGNTQGAPGFTILGNPAAPSTYDVVGTGTAAISAASGAQLSVSGIRISASGTGGIGLLATGQATITISGNVMFNDCSTGHMLAQGGAVISASSGYRIVSGSVAHYSVGNGTIAITSGLTVTLTGTLAFANGFATASLSGVVQLAGVVFSGAATGPRYVAFANGVITTNGAGATFLPGSVAGSTSTGGQYV